MPGVAGIQGTAIADGLHIFQLAGVEGRTRERGRTADWRGVEAGTHREINQHGIGQISGKGVALRGCEEEGDRSLQ